MGESRVQGICEKMDNKESSHTPKQLQQAAYERIFEYLNVPQKKRAEFRKYHFVKQAASRMLETKLSGRPNPVKNKHLAQSPFRERKKKALTIEAKDEGSVPKVSSARALEKLGRSGYKANGYAPGDMKFVGYPKSATTDLKKHKFLKKQLARGNITQDQFDDLNSVLKYTIREESRSQTRKNPFDETNPFF